MHQMLLEVLKSIYHLQNNSGIEMIPVAWKENNILLDTKDKLG